MPLYVVISPCPLHYMGGAIRCPCPRGRRKHGFSEARLTNKGLHTVLLAHVGQWPLLHLGAHLVCPRCVPRPRAGSCRCRSESSPCCRHAVRQIHGRPLNSWGMPEPQCSRSSGRTSCASKSPIVAEIHSRWAGKRGLQSPVPKGLRQVPYTKSQTGLQQVGHAAS